MKWYRFSMLVGSEKEPTPNVEPLRIAETQVEMLRLLFPDKDAVTVLSNATVEEVK